MTRLVTLSLLLFSVFFLLSGVAQAADCYTREQAEAEQGVRIHSELMIIGLNCQHMGKRAGMNLYEQYRAFTARNANLFGGYEKTLMSFLQKRGNAKPEAALNTLRTNYANKISEDAARMRPDVFCSKYAPRISQATAMREQDLRKWASTFYESHPVSYPLCDG